MKAFTAVFSGREQKGEGDIYPPPAQQQARDAKQPYQNVLTKKHKREFNEGITKLLTMRRPDSGVTICASPFRWPSPRLPCSGFDFQLSWGFLLMFYIVTVAP